MMTFWIVAGLLLFIASGGLLLAAWRQQNGNFAEHDMLNRVFYYQRLKELKQDEVEGLVAGREEMVRELQQRLLTDIPAVMPPVAHRSSRWVLLPAVLLLIFVSIGLYCKVGGMQQLTSWQQVRREMPLLRQRILDPQGKPLSVDLLRRLGQGLRAELQTNPNNIQGWMTLGRIGVVLDHAETAVQAFRRANRLDPFNPEAKLNYADVLTRSADEQNHCEAEVLLQEIAKHDRHNLRVQGLLAFNAFQQHRYQDAIAVWQQMLISLPSDDARREGIKGSIEEAKLSQLYSNES